MNCGLKAEHLEDFLSYHRALKQFLSVSNGNLNGTAELSKRAQKARAKLFKLSPSQFYELSTDVYDELQRRIDESQQQPDFLLPKSNFQVKRNEARQTLGSLHQKRFRDLVSDIEYEIERRDLHVKTTISPSGAGAGVGTSGAGNDEESKLRKASLQSTTVIPTKAEIDWGSDDEERIVVPESEMAPAPAAAADVTPALDPTPTFSTDSSPYNNATSQHHKKSNSQDIHTLPTVKSDLPDQQQHTLTRGLSLRNNDKDRDIELLLKEGSKMDQIITQLERKVTLLQSKADKFENEVLELREVNNELNKKLSETSTFKGTPNNTSGAESLKDEEIALLKKQIEELKGKPAVARSLSISSNLSSINSNSLQKLIDNHHGLIPINLIKIFIESVESMLKTIDSISKYNKKSINIDLLFEKISLISSISYKIAEFSPNSTKSKLIKSSVSHSITSIRYFAIYSDLIPKLIIENSIGEVIFSVCEFINEVKIVDNENFDLSEFNLTSNEKEKYSADKSFDRSFDKSNNLANDSNIDTVSPVRPLRMANRIGSNSSIKVEPKSFNLAANISPSSSNSNSNTPIKVIRKTSSNNILSKVRQFEQHDGDHSNSNNNSNNNTNTVSNSDKKPVVSPLSNTIVNKFNTSPKNESFTPSRRSSVASLGNKNVNSTELNDNLDESPIALKVNKLSDFKKLNTTKEVENKVDVDTQEAQNAEDEEEDDEPLKLNEFKKQIQSLKPAKAEDEEGDKLQKEEEEEEITTEPLKLHLHKVTEIPNTTTKELKNEFHNSKNESNAILNTAEPAAIKPEAISITGSTKTIESSESNESNEPVTPTETLSKDIAPSKQHQIDTQKKLGEPETKLESQEEAEGEGQESELESESEEESVAESEAESFDIEAFNIEDPDNTLSELLLYLEHQTVEVITTIQTLLKLIKTEGSTTKELKTGSFAIISVIKQMVNATSNSMNQNRNSELKEHGNWVVESLDDSGKRMENLCKSITNDDNDEISNKHFKQRLAGISFDVAKSTKELVKTIEEANLKQEIENLDKKLAK